MVSEKRINVARLSFVHYKHPDLEKASQFFKDFGFQEARKDKDRIYLNGYGIDPYFYIAEQSTTEKRSFVQGAWAVQSEEDLETAAAHPNSTPIRDNDGPGGGKIVSITDPNGFIVSFVYGQTLRDVDPQDTKGRFANNTDTTINEALDKHRRGHFRRFNVGPSPVHKLGHYGFIVPHSKYQKTYDFYSSLINLKPSDSVYDPKTDENITTFFHMDHGKKYTDHHSMFIGAGPEDLPPFVHHASFEVNDFDTESLGHDWLLKNGWINCWGIGRHVLGSQIFDYWFDASGNIIEHYSDSDLVNEDTPYGRDPESPNSLYIWGPNVPLQFVTGRVEDAPGHKNAANAERKVVTATSAPDPIKGEEARFEVSSTA